MALTGKTEETRSAVLMNRDLRLSFGSTCDNPLSLSKTPLRDNHNARLSESPENSLFTSCGITRAVEVCVGLLTVEFELTPDFRERKYD